MFLGATISPMDFVWRHSETQTTWGRGESLGEGQVDRYWRLGKQRPAVQHCSAPPCILVGGLEDFFIFPYFGKFIIPIDELIFFRGVGVPPASKEWICGMGKYRNGKKWGLEFFRNFFFGGGPDSGIYMEKWHVDVKSEWSVFQFSNKCEYNSTALQGGATHGCGWESSPHWHN